ncbi:MAG: hypothetical protein AAF203_02530 [Pseudomonadota bacterium]
MVTTFYLTQRLLQIAMQQLQQLGNSTWPAMSEIFYDENREGFSERIVDVTEFIAFASGALLSVLVIVNPKFVVLWTGAQTFAGLTLSHIVVINSGVIAISSFWIWCFTGTGGIALTLPMLACQAGTNLLISVLGTYYLGLVGPALGTLISFLFVTQPWTTYLLHREFQVPVLPLTRAWIVPLLLPVSLTILGSSYWGVPTMNTWPLLIFWSLVFSVLALALFPLIFVRARSRMKIYSRVNETFISKLGLKK